MRSQILHPDSGGAAEVRTEVRILFIVYFIDESHRREGTSHQGLLRRGFQGLLSQKFQLQRTGLVIKAICCIDRVQQ
jgi:hypothetical protein